MMDDATPHPDPPPQGGRESTPEPLPQGGRESTPGRNDNRLVSRFRRIAILLVVAIGAFYAGNLAEFQLGGYAPDWAKSLLFYTAPKSNIDYGALNEVFTTIQQHYVKPNANGLKLTEGAASGMVSALGDQFSRYLTPAEYSANQTFLNGQFAGIGASVEQKGDQIVIAGILPGTPAEKNGLKVGDVITAVDGQSSKGWTADTAVNKIRGTANTQVQIQVNRNGQALTFKLTRQEINVPSVATHIFDNRVLYIRIFEFGTRTGTEFDQALTNNLKGSVNMVLLDLRDNPGGYVDQANEVISEFVSSGTTTILVERGGKEDVRKVTGNGHAYTNSLVVLVNENSASASEITAGAIKDHNRGKLVGVKTFGKGSVQQDFLLRDGDLHLTIAEWLTPNRHSIEKTGITPDKTVTLASAQDEYAVDQTPNDFAKDLQLTAALAMLEA
jgi:carboxyl-terminal processing protease